ncbi:T9SS type A sorting domain-containing protein, partial [Candidatus Acetothermia bacterium]|nr:T9SS type A sorting domain-containing protein [Candidatus Acetothermia bacterium]
DGGPGDDSIDGGNGDDNLTGGDGNDTIKGGPGNDVINGDSNNSSTPTPAIALTQGVIPMATSSRNNDVIDGGDGNDIINGGPGNDIILGGTGDDTIDGGPGNDQIVGGLGKDTINAGDGNDTIWISAGDVPAGQTENIDCGPGRDLVNLRNFPRRTKVAKGQLTDPITGGVYKFVSCERFSQTRNAPPKSAPASTLNEIAQPITVTSGMEASASLVVFDLTGQRVFESEKFSGNVSETLQATNAIANGVYFYVISARNTEGVSMKSKVKKLVIVR